MSDKASERAMHLHGPLVPIDAAIAFTQKRMRGRRPQCPRRPAIHKNKYEIKMSWIQKPNSHLSSSSRSLRVHIFLDYFRDAETDTRRTTRDRAVGSEGVGMGADKAIVMPIIIMHAYRDTRIHTDAHICTL